MYNKLISMRALPIPAEKKLIAFLTPHTYNLIYEV